MNTSKYMDKQIMDLSNSQSSINNNDDFLDLVNPPQDDHHRHDAAAAGKEEILPNYDFQPIRSHLNSQQHQSNFDSSNAAAGARVWNSADSKANSGIRNYGSLDSLEPIKVISEKDRTGFDAALLSEIDRMMKKHTDNLMHALEGVSARLTQLETRSRNFEISVDEMKVSVTTNYGSTDGKMRQIENILREVQAAVHDVRDKQEILEAQLQLSKLQVSKMEQQSEPQNAGHMDSMHQVASAPMQQVTSAPMQSHPQLPPVSLTQAPTALPPPNAPPTPPPQNYPPSIQVPNQFPPNQVPPIPQRDPYFPPSSQNPEAPNQQYQLPPPQQLQTPEAPNQHYQLPPSQQLQTSEAPVQHYQQPPPQQLHPPPSAQPHPQLPTQYQPPPHSQYSQPPPPPQQHPSQPQLSVGHHSEEPPYMPSHNYPPGIRQPSGAPPSQQFYGAPPMMYEPPPSRPSSGFSALYGPSSGHSEPLPYGGPQSQYGGGSPRKSPQNSPPNMGSSGYPQLPTARILPQALPTASGVPGGSGSGGGGNKVPIDDVVDKLTSMGFSREQVRATVRKLTENGQSVDLNVVLDKLMNDGVEAGPPRGWFGR